MRSPNFINLIPGGCALGETTDLGGLGYNSTILHNLALLLYFNLVLRSRPHVFGELVQDLFFLQFFVFWQVV